MKGFTGGKTERGRVRNLLLPILAASILCLGGFLMTFFGFIVVLWLLSGVIMYIRSRGGHW